MKNVIRNETKEGVVEWWLEEDDGGIVLKAEKGDGKNGYNILTIEGGKVYFHEGVGEDIGLCLTERACIELSSTRR